MTFTKNTQGMHERFVTKLATNGQVSMLPIRLHTNRGITDIVTSMVTRIGTGKRQHLYLQEWQDHFGVSDADWASRVQWSGRDGVDRVTVHRWKKQQHRLTPEKIAALAEALAPDFAPEQFWRPPSRPSIDAILRNEPIEVVTETMADAVRHIQQRRKAS